MDPNRLWLIRRAAELRRQDYDAEGLMWSELRAKRLGYKFRYQHVIGPFIVDFACPEKRVVVEIDGDTHDEAADARRDRLLASAGWAVYRATNDEVYGHVDAVIDGLLELLASRPSRFGKKLRG